MAVASADATKTETVQSVESSPSRRASDAASDSSSGGLSYNAADPPNSSPNYSREFEIQVSPKSEEYRNLFRLPPDEVLLQDFNCALQENFLLQGHMYVFSQHICFYSNLFGFETKKIIPFNEVTAVRRAKAAGIFPTAIEIIAGGRKYFFTSFLSRDEAFKLIWDGWCQYGNGSKECTDSLDSKSELNIEENGELGTEKAMGSKHLEYESDSSKRQRDIPVLEDPKLPLEGEDGIVSSLGVQDNVEEDAEPAVNNDSSSSRKSLAWVEENSDAPKVPDCFTKVAESKFPIRVEEFFNLFFSDDAVDFLESFHRSCGDKDFRCSSWYPHDNFGHARDTSFKHPIKLYLGAKFGSCQEVQKFRVYRNSHLVIETSQEVNDVPYGDYFRVEGLWDVERHGDGPAMSCIVRIYANVAFSKKTMWKGKIVQNTLDETRDAYAIWIKNAHELLKQKNLEKEERGSVADFIIKGQVHEDGEAETVAVRSQGTSEVRMPQISLDSVDEKERVGDPLRVTLNVVTSVASLFREAVVNFSSSLKSQSQVTVLLVMAFAVILLLMQLSIVVLLTRPQQIQLITQADYTGASSGVIAQTPETMMAWLEKRIHHLKDEMLTIETLLEKMQHEHTFLKAQLNDLEHFRKQRR
ncbi:protein VASCULAR ASSOCIATED DEATH 1, chloroplastic isoform X1 [Rhododendron vialii]|uniref:protein VASCULAR ASSOCIATED DEATH 1, chloroplastic isoform X1 n=1 Tax=Rhododendron vialii TaxID=182163 RepID=UPI00265E7922|nr:protein VASCULAR ASSOCIATED DEATH 1, chloroplastic isoform X1 [Rhododendron vialii]XP_058221722.1 protein VASCULAR ASSOCIATED DEATH 1, chloroplastic isoform X1 [Rhododendron vialii]